MMERLLVGCILVASAQATLLGRGGSTPSYSNATVKTTTTNPAAKELFVTAYGGEFYENYPLPYESSSAAIQSAWTSFVLLAEYFGGPAGFYHGVASGDPLEDAVMIWTRYTPLRATDVITLEFRLAALDPNLAYQDHLNPARNPRLIRGLVEVQVASDFVAKIDVTGLTKNTFYFYAFTDGRAVSNVGQTKTAPGNLDPVSKMNYVAFTCSDFTDGYFHAYDIASTVTDLDMWIHTGDFYYEGGVNPDDARPRQAAYLPKKEVITLQDYRLRHASIVHADEGHRNLRRRAPFMGVWDDHDTATDCWRGGAITHNPAEDGTWEDRVNAAFQAYLEWLPIRHQPGTMGLVRLGKFTQRIEWGRLATFLAFDTCVSYRDREPNYDDQIAFEWFTDIAANFTIVKEYSNTQSKAYAAFRDMAYIVRNKYEDPQWVMIGDEYIQLLDQVMGESAAAGKPWQVWVDTQHMGPYTLPDPKVIVEMFETPLHRAIARAYINLAYLTSDGVQLRAIRALAEFDLGVNRDSHDGFAWERVKILKVAEEKANNMIILSGDAHDSFARVIYEDGKFRGKPVAVNFVVPSVTAGGGKDLILSAFIQPVQDLFGLDYIERVVQNAHVKQDPGLKYADWFHRGFMAVSMTPSKHIAEYIHITDEVRASNYTAARQSSGNITASFFCGGSLESNAGEKGSLNRRAACSAVGFDKSRPAFWTMPVPLAPFPSLDPLTDCGYRGCKFNVRRR